MPKKTPKPPVKKQLDQQCVLTLRPSDQFVVLQNGQQKLMLVSAFINALQDLMAQTYSTAAVSAHTHPESDIVNLGTDLSTLASAIAGKAPTSHVHQIADIKGNFIDGTVNPPIVYDKAFAITAKAIVAAGNAVFQFTADGTAGGAALFPTGPFPSSEHFRGEEGTNPIAPGVAVWSNANKTLTVPVNRTNGALTILGLSVLGATVPANGTVVYATVWGR